MTKIPPTPDLIAWLANGERGVSSNTMVSHLTAVYACHDGYESHPHDPDDLWRCRQLLRLVPLMNEVLPNMAAVSPEWAGLVARWDELCAMMDAEAPDWPRLGCSARETYDAMQAIFDAARAAKNA